MASLCRLGPGSLVYHIWRNLQKIVMWLNVAVTQNRGANIEQFFFFGRFALESWGKDDLT
jgi:hypothetical protein